MQNIILDLNPQSSLNVKIFQRIMFAVMGAGNLYQGYVFTGRFRYVNICVGIIALVFSLFLDQLSRSKEYVFNEDGVEGPMNSKNKINLDWEEVTSATVTKDLIQISVKNGNVHKMNLSNMTHDQKNVVKPKVIELMISKGIEVQTV